MICSYCKRNVNETSPYCPECGHTLNMDNKRIKEDGNIFWKNVEVEKIIESNKDYKSTIIRIVISIVVLSVAVFISTNKNSLAKLEKLGKSLNDNSSEDDTDGSEEYDVAEGGVHQYSYIIDDCTWSEAFNKAKEDGGYLARINSVEEYDYIISEIEDQELYDIKFKVGGRRDLDKQEYYWVDEDNMLYGEIINSPEYWVSSEWMSGEPSFADGDIQEHCLEFYYYKDAGTWVWNDIPDDVVAAFPYYSGRLGYIIEYED